MVFAPSFYFSLDERSGAYKAFLSLPMDGGCL